MRRSPDSQYKWENVSDSEKLQWDGPGAFSACLITNHSGPTVVRNPEPFKTKTNLQYQAICRASGNMINYQMNIKFKNIGSMLRLQFLIQSFHCRLFRTWSEL